MKFPTTRMRVHAHTSALDNVYMIMSEEVEGTLNERCEFNLGLLAKMDIVST